MPKPRTKRGADREERKRKRRGGDEEEGTKPHYESKRQRTQDEDQENYQDFPVDENHQQQNGPGEREFFGMLADEEQEYFRRADEMLELNQFPTTEDRDIFLESVFKEAQGKELKLASSQSCSRLMERLIQLSNTTQKKHLFNAFGSHFLSLVQHRFASHCCEALFLRSAGIVTQELAGFMLDTKGASAEDHQPEASMEELFLATLDELEGSLSFLITDRFASHTLRVLLLVLSGRPLDDISVKTLMKSKKKENISVAGAAAANEQNKGLRAVPASFTLAVQKIIADSTASLDSTGLRVLAKHPIGNPTLQLLLELDMTLNKSEKNKSSDESEPTQPTLLQQLLPGAPKSLSDPSSEASEFVNGMIYDQIGSRLIETLVAHCPGKVFKQLNQNFFLPRIEGYVRNDISCYPAIKVLNRIGKDDLITAADKIAPTVPQLVSKTRYNVLRTLFERCSARNTTDQIKKLIKNLKEGCGSQPADLVTTLCHLSDSDAPKSKDAQSLSRNEYAIQSHGAQLLTTLLSIPGPLKAVHESILALPPPLLLRLAATSMPTVTLLTTALSTPSQNSLFQKSLVGSIAPHTNELSTSQFGHNLINSIAEIPSKGKDFSIPFHVKESIMQRLATQEAELRESWMGRSVWRTWKGDMWKTRRGDWKAWMREIDAPVQSSVNREGDAREKVKKQREQKEE
ncbi:rRNA processing protein Nop9 [Pochonia chlamydosporia 170]|uniref:Nucleolar protein 9 n=1 Tax=Pochonia chlamydosporia 170 TaxID=1380566 RepID=A0A179FN30_METCM|nr:rRNA processing protein Nop9 [Pochonia chlamydosporia 170]OAQ66473.1 rRNA processing protein Nop9 [Pochonia chlamydosporia 170]